MLVADTETTYLAGPLDVLCILHDEKADRYHAAFFEEAPMPGPIPPSDQVKIVRLHSKMHHTEGADSLDEALDHLDALAARIKVPNENIWREPIPWEGEIPITFMRENWK